MRADRAVLLGHILNHASAAFTVKSGESKSISGTLYRRCSHSDKSLVSGACFRAYAEDTFKLCGQYHSFKWWQPGKAKLPPESQLCSS